MLIDDYGLCLWLCAHVCVMMRGRRARLIVGKLATFKDSSQKVLRK